MSGDLVTPCHGVAIHITTAYDVECIAAGCHNSWTPTGIAEPWNESDPIPEMFPGTLADLDALTIRKETP